MKGIRLSDSLKYEKQIMESFASLQKTPYSFQVKIINDVLVSFWDKNKKYVVLNAPTGIGKSVIGAVVAHVCGKIATETGDPRTLDSLILMHNNALTKQYFETFSNAGEERYLMLKGTKNYKCDALTTKTLYVDAESCVNKGSKGYSFFSNKKCQDCEYIRVKRLKNISKNVITNFSYYFVDRQYSNVFEPRTIVIWDEAHTINDAFCSHNAIHFSEERLNKCIEECKDILMLSASVTKEFAAIRDDLLAARITDGNYARYLKRLNGAYFEAWERAADLAETSYSSVSDYMRYSKLASKYFGLKCKISDLLNFDYEHVFEYIPDTQEINVKPVFVSEMFEQTLINSKFNLFMSATISDEYVLETLKLKNEDLEFIRCDPVFPPENKKVIFFKPLNLNYTTMKDPATVKMLIDNVKTIVSAHSKQKQSGIILVPSFDVGKKINDALLTSGLKIFLHKRGDKAEHVLERFKASKTPSLLISPSIYEGVDLPGDISRFQIIVKAPFPSLGDKRMSYIVERHPKIYSLLTIKKIVQGIGRSIRSKEDHAVTYILDANAQRLFNSNQNVWRNEFHVISK